MPHFSNEPSSREDCLLEPIAICGMACRLPGSTNSASQLWELIAARGSVQTPKVPKSRWNMDAHLHDNNERPGGFNVPGGYFLDGAAEEFDPSFFNITPVEAMWMDPQQRKLMEVAYECLESAGKTLASVDGSNTGVYIGCFTADHQQMTIRETSFRNSLAATGVDPGIIAARVGYTFNFKGPAFVVNTACSSSIYAIHNACNALRSYDCEAAIAGGVNLMLTVDQQMNTAKLGVLAPDGHCKTFDARANGYGRAEGAGALYLKRLSDAIRDGDTIRGVIRASATNTNGKRPGEGITSPSGAGQAAAVRAAYAKANFDPNKTAYVECHGTGTTKGDPIEVEAISGAMNEHRNPSKPLILGAIKANIGHSEAASGIFAVMKAAMMTEKAIIPGVCGLQKISPMIHEDEWNIHIPRETETWPAGFESRRAGVSSFGYGGTNGHVIVEDVTALYPWYQHGLPISEAAYNHSSTRPFLVGFSAHDKTTLTRNIAAHAKVANKFYTSDLAYTLNFKRSRFSHRGVVLAKDGQDEQDFVAVATGSISKVAPKLGFIFTGQGAQWATMGRDAMEVFPSFRATIRALDRVLQSSKASPSWTLENALSAESTQSRVGEAEVSQPVCTAIQIAMVDLFAEWNIHPSVTVGHSSGEIGAGYAAGLISAPEAILAAFYRGYAVHHHTNEGSMLAVGLGVEQIEADYASILSNDLVIACVNSPSSVTLSGTAAAVSMAKDVLTDAQVFARELRTGKAYHSPQMTPVAVVYNELLTSASEDLSENQLRWRQPRTRMISSVTGAELTGSHVSSEYWSRNLRSRVLFDDAIRIMATTPELSDVTCMIEVGPHSALAGPFKQICKTNNFERFKYVATMTRNENSAEALLKTAGELFIQNYDVDLAVVNRDDSPASGNMVSKKSSMPLPLVDLPPYQWNYEKKYSAECKFSMEQRQNGYLRHDVLGSRVYNISDKAPIWTNFIRIKDLPWLNHHKLGGEIIFPAAAHIGCAVEAVRQLSELANETVYGVTLRDISITDALVIPDNNDGVQIQVRLSVHNKDAEKTWYSFFVESFSDDSWHVHAEGKVAANIQPFTLDATTPVDPSAMTQRVPGKRWYDALTRIGLEYGPSFSGIQSVRCNGKQRHVIGQVRISDSQMMIGESRYLIHPGSFDGAFQLMLVSIYKGLHKDLHCGQVPLTVEEMTIGMPASPETHMANVTAWCTEARGRYTTTHMKLTADDGRVVIDVKGMRGVRYEAGLPQTTTVSIPRQPYMGAVWKSEIFTYESQAAAGLYPDLSTAAEVVGKTIELLNHKAPLNDVLVIGAPAIEMLKQVEGNVSSAVALNLLALEASRRTSVISNDGRDTLAEHVPNEDKHMETRFREITPPTSADGSEASNTDTDAGNEVGDSRLQKLRLDDGESDLTRLDIKAQDLVVVDMLTGMPLATDMMRSIRSVTASTGSVIFITRSDLAMELAGELPAHGFLGAQLFFPMPDATVIVTRTTVQKNSITPKDVTILYASNPARVLELPEELLKGNYNSQVKHLSNFDVVLDTKVVIWDMQGNILSDTDEKKFSALQKVLTSRSSILWLTSGANEGKSTSSSMATGFLRAIRSERASAKITLLDVDTCEAMATIGAAVSQKLGEIATKDSGNDTEFWLHKGVIHIQRLEPSDDMNTQFTADDEHPVRGQLVDGRTYSASVVEGEIVLEKQELISELAKDEVEIEVSAAQFEKSDFQITRSHGPRVVSGKVIDAGRRVSRKLVGQKVVAYTTDFLSNRIRVPSSLCTPLFIGTRAADVVATLPSLCEAVNVVSHAAKVDARSRRSIILVSPPASAVRAFSGLSRGLGFELQIVYDAATPADSKAAAAGEACGVALQSLSLNSILALTTQHSALRPLMVVSYDFSATAQEVWRRMPAGSQFLVSEVTIDAIPAIMPFQRGASFGACSIAKLFEQDSGLLGQLLQRSMDLFEEHEQLLLQEPYFCDVGGLRITDIVENCNVATYGPRSQVMIKPSASTELALKADAMYLLVGCLGGLGRSLTTLMMDRGARNFAFISRSGADKLEAANLVSAITSAGANVEVFRGDASNAADVEKIVKHLKMKYEIKGVVHAAMVLQDSTYETMTFEQYRKCLEPKVAGARNLDAAFENEDLDFFVMTSSISAAIGNPGQANYCAANSFLDAIAYQRRLRGQAATSLMLPMVLDVGVVAESEGLEEAINRKAMYGIDEAEMLKGFETAMLNSRVSGPDRQRWSDAQIILGLEPAMLADVMAKTKDTGDAYWYNDARLKQLRVASELIVASRASGGAAASGDFTSSLKLAFEQGGEAAALTAIADHVIRKCSNILMIDAGDFEFDGASVGSYGLDSMIGAELRNWLFKEFTLDIAFKQLLAPTLTFKGLADDILGVLGMTAA